jgi:hypothetical protein
VPDSRPDFAEEGLAALDRAGVPYRRRKAGPDPKRQQEADIWLAREQIVAADEALASVEFRFVRAIGRGSHRFYVNFDGTRWTKIDAKFLPGRSSRSGFGPVAGWRASALRLWSALARRLPIGLRRLGPLIAVVGCEGPQRRRAIEDWRVAIPIAVSVVDVNRNRTAASEPVVPSLAEVVRRIISVVIPAYAAAWRGDIVVSLGDWRAGAPSASTGPLTRRVIRLLRPLLPAPDATLTVSSECRTGDMASLSRLAWSTLRERRRWPAQEANVQGGVLD